MKLSCILVFCSPFSSFSQTITRYYDGRWKETSAQNAICYSVFKKQDSLWQRQNYYTSDVKLQMNGWYLDSACKKGHGKFTYYYGNGKLASAGRYINGRKEENRYEFHYNGMMSDSTFYIKGQPSGTSLSWYPSGYLSDSAFFDNAGKQLFPGFRTNRLWPQAGILTGKSSMGNGNISIEMAG